MEPKAILLVGLVGVACLGIAYVLGADPVPAAQGSSKTAVSGPCGSWTQVSTPPVAPPGTVCCVWSKGIMQTNYGGPECFTPVQTAEPTTPAPATP